MQLGITGDAVSKLIELLCESVGPVDLQRDHSSASRWDPWTCRVCTFYCWQRYFELQAQHIHSLIFNAIFVRLAGNIGSGPYAPTSRWLRRLAGAGG